MDLSTQEFVAAHLHENSKGIELLFRFDDGVVVEPGDEHYAAILNDLAKGLASSYLDRMQQLVNQMSDIILPETVAPDFVDPDEVDGMRMTILETPEEIERYLDNLLGDE